MNIEYKINEYVENVDSKEYMTGYVYGDGLKDMSEMLDKF